MFDSLQLGVILCKCHGVEWTDDKILRKAKAKSLFIGLSYMYSRVTYSHIVYTSLLYS